ncbi:WD40-repeat-containing domain protein [Catenaria anguillulae PL171]|uniref:WD40-repeat-containing domain protein n=1 Tax=Catenaria anguillulae PL171 TaxID=765915 RepID=A0A1Y2I5V0_9FUNG|nr:WD40-repeat-containing domain protein [Catenaria anguillulae PL171]
MNLCAVSSAVPGLVFAATRDRIQCMWLNPVTLQCTAKATDPLKHPAAHPDSPHVNHILVGHLGSTEVLVAADDAGRLIVWSTTSLTQPLALLSCPQSAWGISLHAPTYRLAVSCNAHTISLWDFRKDPWRILTGHSNNIPSIAFNADGSKLASVSIDHSCRVWDLQSGACITWTSLDQWGWQVQFVPSTGFFFDLGRNRASAQHASTAASGLSPNDDTPDELLLATTQNQAYLLTLPPPTRTQPTATTPPVQPVRTQLISDLCMLDRIFPDRPRFYYLLQMTRISMLHSLLPTLPLAILANQVGQVGIVRLDMGYLDPPSPPPQPGVAAHREEQDERADQAQVEADQAAAEEAAGGLWSFGNELPSMASSDAPQDELGPQGDILSDHGQGTDEEDETRTIWTLQTHRKTARSAHERQAAPILTHDLTLLDRFPSITSADASELPLYGLLVMPRKVVDPTISGEPQAEWPVYRVGAVNMDGSATWVDIGVCDSGGRGGNVQLDAEDPDPMVHVPGSEYLD